MTKTFTVEEMMTFGEVYSLWKGLTAEGRKDLVPPHGTGGLFTDVAVRPDMYSRVPRVGNWTNLIPMFATRNEKEIIDIVSGVTAQTGENEEPGTCSTTPPVAGKMKTCQQIYQFGIFEKATDTINGKLTGHYIDRADLDRRIINPPDLSSNRFIPDVVAGGADAINTHVGKAYFEFAQGVQLDVAQVDWQGNITNTGANAVLGFQREWNGVDLLVKTGHTDAITGAACAALDSQVVSYGKELESDIVSVVADMYRTNVMNASASRMTNARWVIAVHPYLKYPLFDIWACNYQTARCLPADNAAGRMSLEQVTQLRDSMLRGDYLLIDGEQVPVVTDWGIAATQNESTGVWTSDIFVIAMDDGMRSLLFREFFQFNNPDTSKFQQFAMDEIRIMNNGLYMVGFLKSGAFCYQHVFHMESRLILDAPFLSGRVDDVSFTNSTKFINPFPGGTYHVNGGTTFRSSRLAS